MMLTLDQLAEANKANDDQTDAGVSHEAIFAALGVKLDDVEKLATLRALKATSFVLTGDPNTFATVDDVLRGAGEQVDQRVTILGAFASAFMDGLGTGLRAIPIDEATRAFDDFKADPFDSRRGARLEVAMGALRR